MLSYLNGMFRSFSLGFLVLYITYPGLNEMSLAHFSLGISCWFLVGHDIAIKERNGKRKAL